MPFRDNACFLLSKLVYGDLCTRETGNMNGPAISLLIAYAQQPPVNDHSSVTGGVYFGLSVILSPYSMFTRGKGSSESVCMRRIVKIFADCRCNYYKNLVW